MESTGQEKEAVEVNLTREMMTEMLRRVAGADEDVVVEFKKDEDGNVDKVLEITEHVRELESGLE